MCVNVESATSEDNISIVDGHWTWTLNKYLNHKQPFPIRTDILKTIRNNIENTQENIMDLVLKLLP